MILWGPPGTGKTTVARLVAGATSKAFEPLSAVSAGVKDVREIVERARGRLGEQGKGTILFLDEVHRFNCTCGDAALPPHVEDGLRRKHRRDDGEPVLRPDRAVAVAIDAVRRKEALERARPRHASYGAARGCDRGLAEGTGEIDDEALESTPTGRGRRASALICLEARLRARDR